MLSDFVVIVRRINNHDNIRSCSGILIDYERGIVLTSASLLGHWRQVEDGNQNGSSATVEQLIHGMTFEVIVKLQSKNRKFPPFLALKCQFRSRWHCQEVQEILENCMPKHRWSFDIPPDKQWDDPHIGQDSATTSSMSAQSGDNRLDSNDNPMTSFILLQIVDSNKKLLKT